MPIATPIARRTWSDLYTEALRTVGGPQYSAYQSRLQYWLADSYLRCALLYNHYELHSTKYFTVAAGTSAFPVPGDLYIAMSVAEVDAAGKIIKVLRNREQLIAAGLWNAQAGQPAMYTRSGEGGAEIQFDRPVGASDRRYRLEYYRIPNYPDFTSASQYSELSVAWDAVILDWALMRAGAKVQSDAIVQFNQQLLSDYLSSQIQANATDEPLADMPESPKVDRTRGGLQG